MCSKPDRENTGCKAMIEFFDPSATFRHVNTRSCMENYLNVCPLDYYRKAGYSASTIGPAGCKKRAFPVKL